MATKQFSKITVDSAGRKRSPFDLGGHLSTSFQFGEVLPVHCRKLPANSGHSVGTRALVRLDPMVAPTSQGRMTVKLWHSFIGMSDLFRHYAAFQVGKSIGGSNGLINFDRLPHMQMRDLSLFCLVGAKITPYLFDDEEGTRDFNLPRKRWIRYTTVEDAHNLYDILSASYPNFIASSDDGDSDFNHRFPNYSVQGLNYRIDPRVLGFLPTGAYSQCYLPLGNNAEGNGHRTLFLGENVDIAHCDFVFYNDVPDPDDSEHILHFAFAVNMSNYGSRIFDILTVLGIGVDFQSEAKADLCRLFAYYMAYYGSFGLSKYTNFESSNCNRILKGYENGASGFNCFDFGSEATSPNFGNAGYLNTLFFRFMTDLATGYVTEAVDYISSHRKTDVITNDELGWVQNIVVAPNNGTQNAAFSQLNIPQPSQPKGTTNAVFINSIQHTQVDADLLKLLWKTSNRQTVAGQELEKLLRAGGYGDYVDQQQSHFLGYIDFDIDVTDINATSDSVNTVTGKNSTLGQYVGKGIGANKDDKVFHYDTDELGYWITLCAIVPDSSYCQGNDQTVYDIFREDQYQLEFDSMGYEAHRRSVIKSGADVCNPKVSSTSDEPFGFVPREMRYKVGRSVLAGNFRRRSTRDQYLPFVLSRWLDLDDFFEAEARFTRDEREYITTVDSQHLSDTPIAGDAWRYINLYPWLANFERIFTFDEKVQAGLWTYEFTQERFNRYIYCGERYDYFQLYMHIMHKANAEMLPVSDSYSTTDDNDGNGKTMIQS